MPYTSHNRVSMNIISHNILLTLDSHEKGKISCFTHLFCHNLKLPREKWTFSRLSSNSPPSSYFLHWVFRAPWPVFPPIPSNVLPPPPPPTPSQVQLVAEHDQILTPLPSSSSHVTWICTSWMPSPPLPIFFSAGIIITPRRGNHCRLLWNWDLLLTFFCSQHCTCTFTFCIRSFKKEAGWKYFCRFIFVCFTL